MTTDMQWAIDKCKFIIVDNLMFDASNLAYMVGYKEETKLYFKQGGWWTIPDKGQEIYNRICKLITGDQGQ